MARVSIIVSADGCEARLRIREGATADELAPAALARLARENGIPQHEETDKRLFALGAKFLADNTPLEEVFVRGQQPVHGKDCRLEWEKGLDPTVKPAPEHDAEGRTNHHAGRHYVWVRAGQKVGRMQPATQGTPGKSVRGQAIPAHQGNACAIGIDETLQADDDGNVTALVDGALQLIASRVTVSESLQIKGYVDFETGDVEFPGTVEISEGVRDNFKVRAGSNLSIGGLIESAHVETHGSLTCKGGMAAKGAGGLKVGADAELAFLDQVRGEIGGNLTVRREIRHCELSIRGELHAERASLLSGRVSIRAAAHIGTLGSAAYTPTTIVLAELEPAAADEHEQQEMVAECRTERDNLLAKEKQIRSKGTLTPAAEQTLRTILTAVQEWDHRIQEAEQARAKLEAERRARQIVDLQITGVIHPGVCLHIDGQDYHFHKPMKGPLRIGWDENRVPRYRIADGQWHPLSEITSARRHAA